jgi:small GTP-binding protein
MEGAQYDEFGNYIGPDLTEDESESADEEEELADEGDADGADDEHAMDGQPAVAADGTAGPSGQQIVLHEDKKYYPTADEVYGEGVENLVMDEDAQPLEVPIVAPPKDTHFEVLEKEALQSKYPTDFLVMLANTPELTRNVAVVGHLHHGKTALLDTLVRQTHATRHEARVNERLMRYTDARLDEQTREISIKTTPISLVLENIKGKSYLLNLLDTPGHTNFADEVTAALQMADGALLCVDACEGIMLGTEQALRQAALQGSALTLCITKVDRLITELKIPPADAYFKLRHIIQECNQHVAAVTGAAGARAFDPLKGNVAFSCGLYNFSFTLDSFAHMYCNLSAAVFDPREFAARLWGDVYFHKASRAFKKQAPEDGGERTFVQARPRRTHRLRLLRPANGAALQQHPLSSSRCHDSCADALGAHQHFTIRRFPSQHAHVANTRDTADASPMCCMQFVLEPLYKIFSVVLSADNDGVARMLSAFGAKLKPSAYSQDVKPLLTDVCSAIFGQASGLTEMLVRHVPSSKRAAADKAQRLYTGPPVRASHAALCVLPCSVSCPR